MSNLKKIVIVASILIIVGVFGSLASFKGINKSNSVFEDKTFNEPFTDIDIKTDNAKIEIVSTNDPEATIELSGRTAKNSKYIFSAEVEGDTLSVKLTQKKKLFNFDFSSTSLSVKVFVPEKMYGSIHLESDNGRVNGKNLQANSVNIDTDNGAILLEDVESDAITAEADNGRIEMKHVKASTVTFKSDNGKVLLEDVGGELVGKTSNGSISLVTDNLERPMELETDNGRIKIQTAADPQNVRFDVHVDNGKVDILGSSRSVDYGAGDHVIKLTSNNGSITVTK